MKNHTVLLRRGMAYVPAGHIDQLIQDRFMAMFRSQPPQPKTKHPDPRMRALIKLWDTLAFTPPAGVMQLAAVTDIEQLIKPACITAALREYPSMYNRKLLANYTARLGQPPQLLFKKWNAAIERKHGAGAQQKRQEIEREVKQWHKSGKNTDYHNCEAMLISGHCPYFNKPDMRPGDAFALCWKDKLQSVDKKTPAAFTRAHYPDA